MKYLILFFSSFFLFSPFYYTQTEREGDSKEKIEALEKLKLMEVLKLDEETFIKFFARRNDHQEKMKELSKELDTKREKIKNSLSSITNDNDPELKKVVDSYLLTHQKLNEEKKRFFNSLSDILTYKQIAEFTLFERRFREEIRDVLYLRKKKRMRD